MGDIVRLNQRTASKRPAAAIRLGRWTQAFLRTLGRLTTWRFHPRAFPAARAAPAADHFPVLAYQRAHALVITLGSADASWLEAAAGALDGLLVTVERPLSLWRVVGRPPPGEVGRAPRPSRAGAADDPADLLAAALYRMASTLGWRILERHGRGPDAAPGGPEVVVSWPYRDLRVVPRKGRIRLEVELRGAALHVRVREVGRGRSAVAEAMVGGRARPDVRRPGAVGTLRRVWPADLP